MGMMIAVVIAVSKLPETMAGTMMANFIWKMLYTIRGISTANFGSGA